MAGGTLSAAKKEAEAHETMDDSLHVAAPLAHVLLVLLAVAPLLTPVETNCNILATATLAVYAGSYRSVRPVAAGTTEAMTKQDAMRFPFIGSCVLFGFFLLFKFLPKDLVNKLLTAYFCLLGVFALTGTLAPVAGLGMPRRVATLTAYFGTLPTIPFITDEPMRLELSVPEMLAGAFGIRFCVWYVTEKHWLANNALGLAFSLQGIEFLTLESIQIGAILLVGLFFYDIFWVFFTPVMVTVAKSFDAPIKLLFPRRALGCRRRLGCRVQHAGLGDIVIPGIVALILRMDHARIAQATLRTLPSRRRTSRPSRSGTSRLATTIVAMNVFQAAQPALLYIVPGILGATFVRALIAGGMKEVKAIWAYGEDQDDATEEKEEKETKKSK